MTDQHLVPYTKSYFERGCNGSARSASKIVPELIRLLMPQSVVDIGCGIGTWIGAFRLNGVDDVVGVDGSYIPKDALQVDEKAFILADLSQSFQLDRTFDLAITVEVAEHLPSSRAHTFVADLVRLAPAVAFSAAIPGQGGTNHVNEQWPDYWEAIFAEFNYRAVDCFRPHFWDDNEIEFWYRQNLVLFVSEARMALYPALEALIRPSKLLRLVHPELHIRNCAILKALSKMMLG